MSQTLRKRPPHKRQQTLTNARPPHAHPYHCSPAASRGPLPTWPSHKRAIAPSLTGSSPNRPSEGVSRWASPPPPPTRPRPSASSIPRECAPTGRLLEGPARQRPLRPVRTVCGATSRVAWGGGTAPSAIGGILPPPPLCPGAGGWGGGAWTTGSSAGGSWAFNLGGGVSIEPPKMGGGGSGKGSIDRTINQLFLTPAPKAPKKFLSIENGPNDFHQMHGK